MRHSLVDEVLDDIFEGDDEPDCRAGCWIGLGLVLVGKTWAVAGAVRPSPVESSRFSGPGSIAPIRPKPPVERAGKRPGPFRWLRASAPPRSGPRP